MVLQQHTAVGVSNGALCEVELVSEAGFQFEMSPTSLQYILMTTSRRLLAAVVEGGHGEV